MFEPFDTWAACHHLVVPSGESPQEASDTWHRRIKDKRLFRVNLLLLHQVLNPPRHCYAAIPSDACAYCKLLGLIGPVRLSNKLLRALLAGGSHMGLETSPSESRVLISAGELTVPQLHRNCQMA